MTLTPPPQQATWRSSDQDQNSAYRSISKRFDCQARMDLSIILSNIEAASQIQLFLLNKLNETHNKTNDASFKDIIMLSKYINGQCKLFPELNPDPIITDNKENNATNYSNVSQDLSTDNNKQQSKIEIHEIATEKGYDRLLNKIFSPASTCSSQSNNNKRGNLTATIDNNVQLHSTPLRHVQQTPPRSVLKHSTSHTPFTQDQHDVLNHSVTFNLSRPPSPIVPNALFQTPPRNKGKVQSRGKLQQTQLERDGELSDIHLNDSGSSLLLSEVGIGIGYGLHSNENESSRSIFSTTHDEEDALFGLMSSVGDSYDNWPKLRDFLHSQRLDLAEAANQRAVAAGRRTMSSTATCTTNTTTPIQSKSSERVQEMHDVVSQEDMEVVTTMEVNGKDTSTTDPAADDVASPSTVTTTAASTHINNAQTVPPLFADMHTPRSPSTKSIVLSTVDLYTQVTAMVTPLRNKYKHRAQHQQQQRGQQQYRDGDNYMSMCDDDELVSSMLTPVVVKVEGALLTSDDDTTEGVVSNTAAAAVVNTAEHKKKELLSLPAQMRSNDTIATTPAATSIQSLQSSQLTNKTTTVTVQEINDVRTENLFVEKKRSKLPQPIIKGMSMSTDAHHMHLQRDQQQQPDINMTTPMHTYTPPHVTNSSRTHGGSNNTTDISHNNVNNNNVVVVGERNVLQVTPLIQASYIRYNHSSSGDISTSRATVTTTPNIVQKLQFNSPNKHTHYGTSSPSPMKSNNNKWDRKPYAVNSQLQQQQHSDGMLFTPGNKMDLRRSWKVLAIPSTQKPLQLQQKQQQKQEVQGDNVMNN